MECSGTAPTTPRSRRNVAGASWGEALDTPPKAKREDARAAKVEDCAPTPIDAVADGHGGLGKGTISRRIVVAIDEGVHTTKVAKDAAWPSPPVWPSDLPRPPEPADGYKAGAPIAVPDGQAAGGVAQGPQEEMRVGDIRADVEMW